MEMSQKANIIFFGTSDIAVPSLDALLHDTACNVVLVVTQPNHEMKNHTVFSSPITTYSNEHQIQILAPSSSNDALLFQRMSILRPVVCVLMAYGNIIPESLLTLPQYGWVNIHPSLLPKYRGPSPIQSALLAGERETGVTLIRMDAGVDTGPILASQSIPLLPDDTSETVSKKCAQVAAELLPKTLHKLLSGTLKPIPQPTKSPTAITRKINKKDGEIDFAKPADVLMRGIRAFTPWPGSYFMYNDENIKIIDARDLAHSHLNIGEISYNNGNLLVGAGNKTALHIVMLQRAGKKALRAEDFMRGFPSFGEKRIG